MDASMRVRIRSRSLPLTALLRRTITFLRSLVAGFTTEADDTLHAEADLRAKVERITEQRTEPYPTRGPPMGGAPSSICTLTLARRPPDTRAECLAVAGRQRETRR